MKTQHSEKGSADPVPVRVKLSTLSELVGLRWHKGFGGVLTSYVLLASRDAPCFVPRTGINRPKRVIWASPFATNFSPFVRVNKIPSG